MNMAAGCLSGYQEAVFISVLLVGYIRQTGSSLLQYHLFSLTSGVDVLGEWGKGSGAAVNVTCALVAWSPGHLSLISSECNTARTRSLRQNISFTLAHCGLSNALPLLTMAYNAVTIHSYVPEPMTASVFQQPGPPWSTPTTRVPPAGRQGREVFWILLPLVVVMTTFLFLMLVFLVCVVILRKRRRIRLGDTDGPMDLSREDLIEGEGGFDGVESRWLETVSEGERREYNRAKGRY